MELRQLEQFVAVADEGHFARAAARCAVVPSAVSTTVRVLERELGAPLLRRTTRSVALTDAGRAFLAEARKCLAAADSARSAVGNVRCLLGGTLRLGGIPTFGLIDQPAVLRRLRERHPGLAVRYHRGTSALLIEAVRAGRLDLAIVVLPDPLPADLTVLEVARGAVLLACHGGHRLAGRPAVTTADLADECFVATLPGSSGRDYVHRIFAAAGRPPNIPYEVDDLSALLDFVEQGLGVGLVIDPVALSRPALHTVPIADLSFTWIIGLVAPPEGQISPAAQALIDLIGVRG